METKKTDSNWKNTDPKKFSFITNIISCQFATISRIRDSQEPEYLSDILLRNNRANKIIIPNTSLSLAKKSFCFRGAEDWNKLPETVRSCKSIGQFKSRLKSWIFRNVSPFGEA